VGLAAGVARFGTFRPTPRSRASARTVQPHRVGDRRRRRDHLADEVRRATGQRAPAEGRSGIAALLGAGSAACRRRASLPCGPACASYASRTKWPKPDHSGQQPDERKFRKGLHRSQRFGTSRWAKSAHAWYPDEMASKKRNGPTHDLNTTILLQIRDEMKATREELRGELHETNERLERLERRQTEDAVRVATELVSVAHAVGQVRDLLRDQRVDRGRLDDFEHRISTLEKRP